MSNPLLEPFDLAPYDAMKAEHIVPAIGQLLEQSKQAIEQKLAEKTDITWENFMLPLDQIDDRLSKVWSAVSHINSVKNSDEWRAAYDQCLPLLSDYQTWLGQNQLLFKAVESLYQQKEHHQLDPTQVKILEDQLRDFKLAGVSLPAEQQKRYGEIKKKLSELSSKFEQNVLDATMAWSQTFDNADALQGLPESSLALAKQLAEQNGETGYRVNLEFPSFYSVMTYADDQALRAEMYRAYTTRASELSSDGKFDNSKSIEQLIRLRSELANLLDFDNYAELSLASKMAENGDQVTGFLEDLAAKSKAQAKQELAELAEFAEQSLSIKPLNAWDVSYASEKLKQARYSISDEQLKPYFPIDQVLKGLFEITETLFKVTINESRQSFEKWHKDARLFEVMDGEGNQVARFYLDLYARPHKRGGAWMADYAGRFRDSHQQLQRPVAFLTCNFNPPIGDQPALLTHDEVVTLFHEFGHGLHHMLTQIDYLSASGINGVEWDAVELPSQFMENFCYQKEGLDRISGHFETGEPLPQALLDKLQASKNFQSAMMMVRQLEFALFDFRLHREARPDHIPAAQQILNEVRDQVAVVIPPEWNRFQNSFTHIFAGGYAAGYYSYKWAEVLSADAFAQFEEQGVLNQQTGQHYWQTILSRGGSRSAMENFKAFRGREPDIEPLLRHSGIAA